MENAKHDRECNDCDLETTERLNYFTGQFLTERDFRAEQEYQIGKHRQHNRYLHGYGTVCGLKIVQHPNPDCQDRFVILEPGLALDCCGREIVVKEKVYIDLVKLFAAQNIDLNSINPEEKKHLLFSLCYEECKTEFVPALYSECGCDEFGCDANRIVEGFGIKLQLLKDLPKPLHEEPDGVSLDWITTLSLNNAVRVVLDPNGARIYVLTSAEQGQIMVYDTKHHCLLRSIDIKAHAADLSVSPDGKYLYIIRGKIETETQYFLEVLNVEDLSNIPAPVNKLPLNTEPLDFSNPPQVVVAADGKIYILDPKGKTITIWKTDINTGGTGTTAQYGSPISITNNPKAIAVSSDNRWLFFAEENSNAIKAIKVDTPPSTSPSVISIDLTAPNDNPLLLAVSGDSKRLYVVAIATSGDKKVRAFQIEETPVSFPEIKPTSASINIVIGGTTDTPTTIAVSPSGKWVYVLLKTSDGKGIIKVIDGGKIATTPDRALAESVIVVSDPQDLVLDPEQQRIYVAGKGNATTKTCGGISVIDVKGKQCSEVIWRALDGCPECPDDNCVPLAIVADYVKNYRENPKITNDRIENRKYRPLVTSTETLKQLVICALETGGGGANGKDGTKGDKGDPGSGLNLTLPKIVDISWTHGDTISWEEFADNFALRVYFDREMTGIDLQTFKVWIDYPGFLTEQKENILNITFTGLYNITNLRNDLTSTSFESIRTVALDLFGSIKPALETGTTPAPRSEPYKWIVDFKINQENQDFPRLDLIKAILTPSWIASKQNQNINFLPCVHIMLKGDFIKTPGSFNENEVLDADNIGGQVGSNRNSGNSTQGGDFESWFFLGIPDENLDTPGKLGEVIKKISSQ
jgi:DNA-binding beta-propeller fold protein YncE